MDRWEGFRIHVPPTRSDIMHACDVMEDVAIAYGYNNLPESVAFTATEGQQHPLNKVTEQLRQEIAQAGYMEVLSFGLVSGPDGGWGMGDGDGDRHGHGHGHGHGYGDVVK
jgi:phenylalanyl-tRNA synthetase beta subunit